MDFHIFKRKKKKPTPAPPPPKQSQPPAAPERPPPPPKEHPQGARGIPFDRRQQYMDELERMSRVPGMRNFEVTSSRTFRWNFNGCDYEYCVQDQGPAPPYWSGGIQRPPIGMVQPPQLSLPPPRQFLGPPPRQFLGPPPEFQYGPPPRGVLRESPHLHYDYGYGGVPSAFGHPHGGGAGYHGDEYDNDCSII